jgi:uncharacterized protein (TIGR02300 family)
VSAATDARGLKRVCVSCGIRFYDLNKRPIHCPNCETEFSGEIKLKSRRGRASAADLEAETAKAKAVPAANDDQSTVEERDDGVVSLEDVEAMENSGNDSDEEDVDIDDDDIGSLEEIEEEEDLEVPEGKKED